MFQLCRDEFKISRAVFIFVNSLFSYFFGSASCLLPKYIFDLPEEFCFCILTNNFPCYVFKLIDIVTEFTPENIICERYKWDVLYKLTEKNINIAQTKIFVSI